MENRKKKKWDLGKALEEGVQQLSKDVKEAFKDLKSTAQSAIKSHKSQKTPASGATSEGAYFQEKNKLHDLADEILSIPVLQLFY